ncbi:MAG: hypothetical protein Q9199_004906 [Rusavskia elegans]
MLGATGYVGGHVMYRLQQSSLAKLHLSYLVRDSQKASQLSKSYPGVEIIQGDLDDANLLEKEARKAGVVLNLAATGPASAIVKGIQEREMPATLFAAAEIAQGRYSQLNQEVHDDLKDSEKIRKTIRSNPMHVVENIIISQLARVRTALSFGELSNLITAEAHSQEIIKDPEIKEEIDAGKANSMSGHAAVLWATNAVIKSSQSQAQLGWTPKASQFSNETATIVESEAESQRSHT